MCILHHPITLITGFQYFQITDWNELTTLPSEIGQMASLQTLELRECECVECDPCLLFDINFLVDRYMHLTPSNHNQCWVSIFSKFRWKWSHSAPKWDWTADKLADTWFGWVWMLRMRLHFCCLILYISWVDRCMHPNKLNSGFQYM